MDCFGDTQMAIMRINSCGSLAFYNNSVTNGMYSFSGNCIQVQSTLQNLKDLEAVKISDANLSIAGTQIKPQNMCCFTTTIIVGSILILPLIFMCFQWWKKIVFPIYQIPIHTYQQIIQRLVRGSHNLKNLTLRIVDGTFNEQKARILYDAISKSSLKGLTLINYSYPVNYQSDQYEQFISYMKPFKSLPIMSDIRWSNQIVL